VNLENPSAENQKTVDKYSLDLYYTTHFPLTEKYIALYPKSETQTQEVQNKRDRIRKQLHEEMLHGKKKISGSNTMKLGRRKLMHKGLHEPDEDEIHNGDLEESGEDEFLDIEHKKH
jgi:hypothetical protein